MNPLADARQALITAACVAGELRAEAEFPIHLPVFSGHFPGRPLLPGVACIALVQAAYEHAEGRRMRIVAVERCKWKTPTVPGERVQVKATIAERGPQRHLKATLVNPHGVACEMHLLLAPG